LKSAVVVDFNHSGMICIYLSTPPGIPQGVDGSFPL